MAKKVTAVVKIQIPAGKATPAPPVGSTLGPYGINMMEFVKTYNERTASQIGSIVPAVITIYEDRSFQFITKAPPSTDFIKKALGIERGSGAPGKTIVGSLTRAQLRTIAEAKMADLNTIDVDEAMKIIAGTARSMGITVEPE